MSGSLFGTDGIRGPFGEYPLDKQTITRVVKAAAMYLSKTSSNPMLLAMDTRESSPKLAEYVTEGITQAGLDCVHLGVMPTAALAYTTREQRVAGSIMITASHNPYSDNGIKIFDASGNKLTEETELHIMDLFENGAATASEQGKTNQKNLVQDYVNFVAGSTKGKNLEGCKIAVDTANGATTYIAEQIFAKAGASVEMLHNTPNGQNINDRCGSTDTSSLAKYVRDNGFDAGIAFDGDGDRVVIVDHLGRELDGDHLLYILAVSMNEKEVVATVMANGGLERALDLKGIKMSRVSVGDHHVIEALVERGLHVGGEQNGHIVLAKDLATSDGLLAGILAVAFVWNSGSTLAQWRDMVPLVPQTLVNITLHNRLLIDELSVKQLIEGFNAEVGINGRLLIRPSGTEPLLRIMVETENSDQLAKKFADILTVKFAELEALS